MDRLDKEVVAANVKRFIQANGYSKQSFAKKLSMPRIAIDQMLAGKMQVEELHKHLEKMTAVFQLRPTYFLNPCQFESPKHAEMLRFSNQLSQLKEQNPKNQQLLSDLEDVLDIAALYL